MLRTKTAGHLVIAKGAESPVNACEEARSTTIKQGGSSDDLLVPCSGEFLRINWKGKEGHKD